MMQTKGLRMEGLPRHFSQKIIGKLFESRNVMPHYRHCPAAIGFIAEHRMSDMLHVNSDLMCPSGLKFEFNKREAFEFFYYKIFRDSKFSAFGNNGKFFPILRMSSYLRFDLAESLLRISPADRLINT